MPWKCPRPTKRKRNSHFGHFLQSQAAAISGAKIDHHILGMQISMCLGDFQGTRTGGCTPNLGVPMAFICVQYSIGTLGDF